MSGEAKTDEASVRKMMGILGIDGPTARRNMLALVLSSAIEGAEAMDAAWIAFIGDKLTAATKATPYAINEGHQADIIGQRRGFVALLETSTLDAREVVEKLK